MKTLCSRYNRWFAWIGPNLIRGPKIFLVLLILGLFVREWFYSKEISTPRSNRILTFQRSSQMPGKSTVAHSVSSSHFTTLPGSLLRSTPAFFGENRESFALWKSIKLQPRYKKGNVKHVRFGEPLQLFTASKRYGQDKKLDRINFDMSVYLKTNGLVDCKGLILGHERVSEERQTTITAAIKHHFQQKIQSAKYSCEKFFLNSGYVTSSLTSEERDFPIAFSIVIFKDVEQFEILLKSIYRPQNVYCIHIDKKSPDTFTQAVNDLIACLDNVFVATTSVDVKWGTFSVLEPDIVCLRELFKYTIKWKYFINLTGQELPLRTNYELVKILKAFNGANNVGATYLNMGRLKRSGLPPHGARPVKGAVHVILSRDFVDFILNNETAIDIYEWSKNVGHASEIYFSTLNYNPAFAAPGSFRGRAKSTGDKNPLLARLKNWGGESYCSGRLARRICILSPDELPLMATREELFANKLHFDYHPEMLVCMPELIFNRTLDEYNGFLLFNDTYYKTREFVINRF